MTNDIKKIQAVAIATMIVESLAMNLAGFPEKALEEATTAPEVKKALKSAVDIFQRQCPVGVIKEMREKLFNDVSFGLQELDDHRKQHPPADKED